MSPPRLSPVSPPEANAPLPYGRHLIEADDIAAVVAALRSDHLAHGPRVSAFERALAEATGAREAVACASGTAALHLALAALDVGPGDACIVPAVTFLSTATAARMCGAEAVFTDVDPDTGLMTPETLAAALAKTARVKAVLPVHLGGRSCDMAALAHMAAEAGAHLVEDAAHAVGGTDGEGRPVGACAHAAAATFSFHPVKTLAAGEGGAATLNDPARAERMRRLRNHAVTREPERMTEPHAFDAEGRPNPWAYEQMELGFNYRMDEMSAALGLSQLAKLPRFVARRRALAARYDQAFESSGGAVEPVAPPPGARPALHLYAVRIDFEGLGRPRAEVMRRLSAQGVGTQVHYIPLYRQPYFRARYGDMRLPGAEAYYARALALPLFPAMREADVDRVVAALLEALS